VSTGAKDRKRNAAVEVDTATMKEFCAEDDLDELE
jgi:hypothetical protein